MGFTGLEVLTSFSSGIAQHFQGWMWGLKTDPHHITGHLSFPGQAVYDGGEGPWL